MVASGACSDPAWTWDRPRDERTKTSHSGQEALRLSVISLGSNQVCISGVLLTTSLFFGIRSSGFANPGTVCVCFTTMLHTLTVAWARAVEAGQGFVPGQCTEGVVTALVVPLQIRVRQGQAESFGLRDDHVNETLP